VKLLYSIYLDAVQIVLQHDFLSLDHRLGTGEDRLLAGLVSFFGGLVLKSFVVQNEPGFDEKKSDEELEGNEVRIPGLDDLEEVLVEVLILQIEPFTFLGSRRLAPVVVAIGINGLPPFDESVSILEKNLEI
jgi:hypothetical protein